MNAILEQINSAGYAFVEFAVPMLVQSSVLIVMLLLADLLLRKKVRAVFRYCIWMLVLVKLVLPSSLSSPVSFGYWFGDELPSIKVTDKSAAVSPVNMSKMAEPASIEVSSEAPAVAAPMMDVEPAVVEAASWPVVTSVAPVTWQGVVFLVWLAVVVVMGLLLLQRAIFVIGLVAQAKGANRLMEDTLEYCRKRVGVKGKVGLKVSANATSPAVCGLFRPVILVPENLGPSLGAGGLRVVLMHELAHIKRGDLWVNLVQTLLQIIYFYNPMLWLANAMIRRVREQAVDEAVQVAMGEKAKQYPETLVNVAKLAFKRPALSLRLIGVVESKSALKGRIKHMLSRPIPKSAKLGILSLVVVLIVGAVLLPMAKAEKQKTEVRSQKTEFAATLPNGVTVELVGVCEHPSEGKQWWRPDGSLLAEAPYESREGKPIANRDEELNCLVEFAVKLSGADLKNMGLSCEVPGATRTSVNGAKQEDASGVLKIIACEISRFIKAGEVHVGVAVGQWETIATQNVGFERDTKDETDTGFITWGIVGEEQGEAMVIVTHNVAEYDCRVVAEDKDGNVLKALGSSGGGADDLRTTKYTFGVGMERIAKFQFQTRPYEGVEFKDISLKPGHKMDVQVEVEKSEVNRFYELLNEAVTVDIEHSPRNERLSVQYAVIAICEAAGVPYQWEKSSRLSGAKCRQYIEPVHIKNVLAEKAIRDVVFAVGLTFEVDDHGLYLTPNSDTNHLQSLIDSARRGGTVIVPRGVYTEPIEINKSLTLKGKSRADCVFEVTEDKPAIFVNTKGKGKVIIEGITVKWQLATSDNMKTPFALYVKDSKAEVKNCSFLPLGNFKRSVVAVRTDGFSNLTISRCRFEGFEYVVGYGEGTEGTVSDNLIMDCGHQGITLYEDAKVQIIRNVITGSRYHAVRSTGGTLHMKDNLIINNANRGVYLGNKSARGTISNNIIMGNATGISGFAESKVKIENNIIADSSYAGIGMRESCSLVIRNNIFQGNERGWILFKEGGKGGNTVYRNTFWKNRIDAENFRKTANSVEAEPGFVDPDNGDFSLRRGLAKGYKQGLTKPQVFKTLWKRWQNRADKNILFSRAGEIDVEVGVEETGEVSDADKMASENFSAEGWALWRQRKLAEAERVFKKAVSKDPKNANAWNGLGWSQFNQGKSLNAKVSFEKCLKIQPKHAAALNGLGWIAKGQGKTDEAIGHWEKAIEATPGATAALNGLATTYMELKQYDKAGKYYEMWLNVEPDNADAKAGLEKAKAVLKRK